jgi:hypothetical protein
VKAGEVLRWFAGLTGILLWLAIPLVFIYGPIGPPCEVSAPPRPEDCFSDYIPILELFAVPLFTLVTCYPFARFAFSLYAPPPPRSRAAWWFASHAGAGANWPLLQIFAAAGCAWILWRMVLYISWDEPFWIPLFRLVFLFWFVAGIVVGWRQRRRDAVER